MDESSLQSFVDGFVEFDQVLAQRKLIGADVVQEIFVWFDFQVAVEFI